jgi:glycosyltransferase involved in cell wall biosynthesis
MYKPCAVIPVYNHGKTAGGVVDEVVACGLPVILVDDGSAEETRVALLKIEDRVDECSLFRLDENQGKGGAVIRGLLEAHAAGYSHAIQIDADGQHDLEKIRTFIEASRTSPSNMICGYPEYDESVPSSRKSGRRITNFWVTLETLSRDIKDAMCGFRVYPLDAAQRLLSRSRLGKRMEFDIEILVKLHWMGVRMIFLPIKVIYPEDGMSNFRMFHDNVAISLAHSRLFFGMIPRLPVLLVRRISRFLESRRNAGGAGR